MLMVQEVVVLDIPEPRHQNFDGCCIEVHRLMEQIPEVIMRDEGSRQIKRQHPIEVEHWKRYEDDKDLIEAEREEQSGILAVVIVFTIKALIEVTMMLNYVIDQLGVQSLYSREEQNEGVFMQHPAMSCVFDERHGHEAGGET
jgi:hypothetical protein